MKQTFYTTRGEIKIKEENYKELLKLKYMYQSVATSTHSVTFYATVYIL